MASESDPSSLEDATEARRGDAIDFALSDSEQKTGSSMSTYEMADAAAMSSHAVLHDVLAKGRLPEGIEGV
eukprot:scaffold2326_cov286-Pinguiococcus_pyrenoidosus.AAC.11